MGTRSNDYRIRMDLGVFVGWKGESVQGRYRASESQTTRRIFRKGEKIETYSFILNKAPCVFSDVKTPVFRADANTSFLGSVSFNSSTYPAIRMSPHHITLASKTDGDKRVEREQRGRKGAREVNRKEKQRENEERAGGGVERGSGEQNERKTRGAIERGA